MLREFAALLVALALAASPLVAAEAACPTEPAACAGAASNAGGACCAPPSEVPRAGCCCAAGSVPDAPPATPRAGPSDAQPLVALPACAATLPADATVDAASLLRERNAIDRAPAAPLFIRICSLRR